MEHGTNRKLKLNKKSKFFNGLDEMEMDTRIRRLLSRYADFDFRIDTTEWEVSFSRDVSRKSPTDSASDYEHRDEEGIKISRGEENIFIWCFFLVMVQLVMDDKEREGSYGWVEYLYIDDPISSLDEHNAILVAHHLATLLKDSRRSVKTIISTHHGIFFNVLYNELKKTTTSYFLSHHKKTDEFSVRPMNDTPFFHHVAALVELDQADREDRRYPYHFNVMRSILEKTASFHGYEHFSALVKCCVGDQDESLYTRILNLLSHGNYALFEPRDMLAENKKYFRTILRGFIQHYHFHSNLFQEETKTYD